MTIIILPPDWAKNRCKRKQTSLALNKNTAVVGPISRRLAASSRNASTPRGSGQAAGAAAAAGRGSLAGACTAAGARGAEKKGGKEEAEALEALFTRDLQRRGMALVPAFRDGYGVAGLQHRMATVP